MYGCYKSLKSKPHLHVSLSFCWNLILLLHLLLLQLWPVFLFVTSHLDLFDTCEQHTL